MVNAKIDFIPFSFCQEDERYVTELYRLCKDQERKLFDLTRNTIKSVFISPNGYELNSNEWAINSNIVKLKN